MVEIEKPRIECVENPGDASYGKYVVEPLERGYGTTLGNSLRRILLSSLQRRQQNPAQGVAQGGAVAALQGLNHILAIGGVAGVFYALDAGLFDFYHMLRIPSFFRRRAAPPDSAHQYLEGF